jgi:hypothetical protein
MADYGTIVVTPAPKGVFITGIISGTPKPGTMLQIQAGTAKVNGSFTWEVFNGAADGERTLVAILVEDSLQGKLVSDAFVTGTLGTLYCPVPGEQLQVLFNNVAGTADDVAIGDKMIVDDGTGKFNVTTGSPESEPFIALEALTDPT